MVCVKYLFSVAPMKALCTERYEDWCAKFNPLGLKCKELTGDTEIDDYFEFQDVHIILTTPVCNCCFFLLALIARVTLRLCHCRPFGSRSVKAYRYLCFHDLLYNMVTGNDVAHDA